jgi:hypothetical protein
MVKFETEFEKTSFDSWAYDKREVDCHVDWDWGNHRPPHNDASGLVLDQVCEANQVVGNNHDKNFVKSLEKWLGFVLIRTRHTRVNNHERYGEVCDEYLEVAVFLQEDKSADQDQDSQEAEKGFS